MVLTANLSCDTSYSYSLFVLLFLPYIPAHLSVSHLELTNLNHSSRSLVTFSSPVTLYSDVRPLAAVPAWPPGPAQPVRAMPGRRGSLQGPSGGGPGPSRGPCVLVPPAAQPPQRFRAHHRHLTGAHPQPPTAAPPGGTAASLPHRAEQHPLHQPAQACRLLLNRFINKSISLQQLPHYSVL